MASTHPRRGSRAAATVLLWMFVVIACWGFAWVVAPDVNADGRCEGIGFGCTPTPRDTVALLGLFVWPMVLGTLVLGWCSVAVVQRRRWLPRWGGMAVGSLAALMGLVLTLGLAVVLVGVVGLA